MKYKIGDPVETGVIPCSKCKNRHVRIVTKIKPFMSSWKNAEHDYAPMDAEIYIQEQRNFINRLLESNRRLRSALAKKKRSKR